MQCKCINQIRLDALVCHDSAGPNNHDALPVCMSLSAPTKNTQLRSLTTSGHSQKTCFCVVQPVISKPIGNRIVPGTMLAAVRENQLFGPTKKPRYARSLNSGFPTPPLRTFSNVYIRSISLALICDGITRPIPRAR